MSNQGAAPIIDVSFDGHKYSQVTQTMLMTGTTNAYTVRFSSLNRVTFILSCINTSDTGSSAIEYIGLKAGTTTADQNVVGLTIVGAAGLTLGTTITVMGI